MRLAEITEGVRAKKSKKEALEHSTDSLKVAKKRKTKETEKE